ncbi:MAG: hypothetical protein J6Q89_08920 [Clostridia bacterium]|nr:hypothetical protein [Clostridia bacterium]
MKSVAVLVKCMGILCPFAVDGIATLLPYFSVKAFLYFGGFMSDKKYPKEDCITLLKNKYQELQTNGLSRYPQRSDCEAREVVAIKAFLGPWPRALEQAGIKPPRDDDRLERNREKRARAKKARIEAIKNAKQDK